MIDQESHITDLPELEALSHLERRFVNFYVADPKRNRTQAAIKAGYSEKSARSKASQLLTKVNISEAVKALETNLRSEAELLPKMVARLSQLGFNDRYVATAPSDPLLPGLEDAFVCQVDHSVSLAAIKLLAQICGVGEPEKKGLEVSGEIFHSHELSPAVSDLLNRLSSGDSNDDPQ